MNTLVDYDSFKPATIPTRTPSTPSPCSWTPSRPPSAVTPRTRALRPARRGFNADLARSPRSGAAPEGREAGGRQSR
ncbi:hypothetical protein QJS66_18995 [Kocuria rhizophila]|nr:hypothetical protein QJS66_18995 [Kocuria rhizophila]